MLETVGERLSSGPEAGSAQGTVLIATHGAGRGRRTGFLLGLMKRMGATRPELSQRVTAWLTGTPPPPLDDVRAIVFMLADPIEHFPLCEVEARNLASDARERGIRLVNPPVALNNSVKSRQAALWTQAGVPCAGGRSAANATSLRGVIEAARYPVILRFDDRHMQDGAAVCRSREEALEWMRGNERYPVAMLDYIDTRETWRTEQPDSVFADYFHKRRSMVFGSRVLNNHIFFSTQPIVGSKTCTFSARNQGAPRIEEMLEADLAFSRAPAEQPELMQAAVRALGLDMAAIDYSTCADGSVVLWEANPFFQLPHWSNGLMTGPRQLKERIARMMDSMIDELEALAGGGVDG